MAPSRVGRAVIAAHLAAGVLVALPVVAALVDPGISPVFKAIVLLVAGLTLVRPAAGLGAVILLLPLALAFEIQFGSHPATAVAAECLFFTFAATALMRARPEAGAAWWLGGPALVMAAAVAASLVVEISDLQTIAPSRPVWRQVWVHLTAEYWRAPTFAGIH